MVAFDTVTNVFVPPRAEQLFVLVATDTVTWKPPAGQDEPALLHTTVTVEFERTAGFKE